MPDLTTIDQVIFISVNAVNYYFDTLKKRNINWPTNIQVIAVGDATAATLIEKGITVQHVPEIADSEHVIELETLQQIQHQRILLIKGIGGRTTIQDTLKKRDAILISLDVYQRSIPIIKKEFIDSLWQDDAVDIILFTSQLAIENLFHLLTIQKQDWIRHKPCIVISDRLANIAGLAGIKTILISRHDKILETLRVYNQGGLHDNPG